MQVMIVALAALAAAAAARAVDAPARAQGLCGDASTIQRTYGPADQVVTEVRRACKPGDRIVITRIAVGALLCDQTKPMMNAPDGLICTLGPLAEPGPRR